MVEDNMLVAMHLTQMVEDCGCRVVGPAGCVAEAVALIDGCAELAGALLDVNLGEERVWPVAEMLDGRGVPFVLATGYVRTDIPEAWHRRPVRAKPFGDADIRRSLVEMGVIAGSAEG